MCEARDARKIFQERIVGFIGAGNMAKAIGVGLLKKGVLKSSQVVVSAPSDCSLGEWRNLDVRTTNNNIDVVNKCDIIILAFKPYQLQTVMEGLVPVEKSKLFISILVGVPNETIMSKLVTYVQPNARLVRTMPNLAVSVGEGCTVIAPDATATPEDIAAAKAIFSNLGTCEEISESLMDSVAAIAGSGPAYIFMVIEAMADGAVKQGVPRQLAYNISAQTVVGASKLVLESKKHPGQLKDEVCSAGGTTICGVHELEKGGLRSTFMNAVQAATNRAREMRAKPTQ